jgi:hypothetical protein
MKLLLCNFFQPPATSCLLGPNILLSNLFSKALNLCPSFNVKNQVSHPYKSTGDEKIKKSELNGGKHSPKLILMSETVSLR